MHEVRQGLAKSVYLFLWQSLQPALHVAFDEEVRWQILFLIHNRLRNEDIVNGMGHQVANSQKQTDSLCAPKKFRSK